MEKRFTTASEYPSPSSPSSQEAKTLWCLKREDQSPRASTNKDPARLFISAEQLPYTEAWENCAHPNPNPKNKIKNLREWVHKNLIQIMIVTLSATTVVYQTEEH
uniref:Uncharacterized protein n=1 Tax=Ralstonia solanacearum TaxID=305 RepID=A0A0S4TM24_RALSL|nr:protein of unknown function [Ralstonia solanacearum]